MRKHLNLSAPGRPPYAMQAVVARKGVAVTVKALASATPAAGYEPAGEKIALAGPTLEDARHEAERAWRSHGSGAAEGYWITNSDGAIVDIVTES